MVDPNFYSTNASMSLKEVAILVDAEKVISGEKGQAEEIKYAADISDVDCARGFIFLSHAKQLPLLLSHQAALCFLTAQMFEKLDETISPAIIIVENPKQAFARLANRFHQSITTKNEMTTPQHFEEKAHIHPSAVIDATAMIEADCEVGPHVYIGPGVQLGQGSKVSSHVHLSHTIIGKNCQILANAVIGEPGFGFIPSKDGLQQMPQLGRVLIEENVHIGANTTIDRGTLNDTKIGAGTKIDNLVQIAHNVRIGKNCAIASQVGISGSTCLGDNVMVGGQVGFADHLHIGEGAMILAGAGLMRDVPPKQRWGGIPAQPARDWLRSISAISKLSKSKK